MRAKAVVTENKKQYERVLKIFEKRGWRWQSGVGPFEFNPKMEFPISLSIKDCFTYDDIRFGRNSLYGQITYRQFIKEVIKEIKDLKNLENEKR